MFYSILLFPLFYFSIQAQPVEDVYYQSAIIFFNYSDKDYQVVVGSEEQDSGIYGSHSPKKNVSGPIVLPQADDNGCEEAIYTGHENYTVPWIALVARGKCTFYAKIKQATKFNASAVIIFDRAGETTPVIMNTEGADDIVSVSIPFELGDAVRSLVQKNFEVTGSIIAGNAHSSAKPPIRIERTSIIFVSVSFMILMIVSLAWLVFYYIQKFRLIRNQHRGAQRQRELFTRALALTPTRHLKSSDQLLDSENMCAICLELYKVGDHVRNLPCKHDFHKRCVDPWLQAKQTCPMCKVNVMKSLGLAEHDNPTLVADEEEQRNEGESPMNLEEPRAPFAEQPSIPTPYTDIPENAYSDDAILPQQAEETMSQSDDDRRNLTV